MKLIEAKEMLVTPKIAEDFLRHNIRNRTVSDRLVSLYAREMSEGRWERGNPSPIVFGKSGELKDGQHRLLAVVRSGIPTWFLLATVADDVNIFDAGRARSCTDYMKMFSDVDNSLQNVRIVSAVTLHIAKDSRDYTPRTVVEEYIENNQEELKSAREICCTRETRKAAFVHAIYCALKYGVSFEQLNRFAEVVKTGLATSEAESAAVFCRNYLQKAAKLGRRDAYGESKRIQTYIKKFIDGEHMKQDVRSANGIYSDYVYKLEGKCK